MSTETAPTPEQQQQQSEKSGIVNMAASFDALLKDVITQKPAEAATDKPADKPAETKPPEDKGAEHAADKPAEAAPEAGQAKADAEAKVRETELENPAGLSPKASEKFNALKASRDRHSGRADAAEAKLKERDAEITALKQQAPTAANTAELEQVRRERDELSQIVKVHAIQSHPKFKQYFDKRTGDAVVTAKQIVGADLAPQLEAALKLGDAGAREEALQNLMDEMPSVRSTRLGAALAQLDSINQEREQALTEAGANAERLQAEEFATGEKQKQTVEAQRRQAIDVAQKAAANFDGFKTKDGDEKHNAEVEGRKQFITEFLHGNVKPELIPLIPLMVGEYLYYKNSLMPAKDAELATLRKQVADMTGASPKPTGGGSKPQAAAEPKGFISAFKDAMAGVGQ